MSNKILLKDRVTGEAKYPVTFTSCVVDNDGNDLKTILEDVVPHINTLDEALQADKTNLKNFKEHVEADFVKDADYNNDKATIMGQIMNKADSSMFWVGTQAEYDAITTKNPKTLYFIKES